MRRFFWIILYPFLWVLNRILEWWYYFRKDWKEDGFRWAFKSHITHSIKDSIEYFFYEHHHNGVFGPGGHGWRTFKSGNLALLIAILTAVGFIIYVIVN